ncbi:hypothetical protein [Haloferax sp. DFSO60]|uniref:hypothetical protein n=1 Tax=Haloferax sp. DFSO60 TaxID=3388652 RepID=UPI00397BD4FF
MNTDSTIFTYGAPFIGVLLVAIGIAAAVPGVYALIQDDITSCGTPTIAVESPEETATRFGDSPELQLTELSFDQLTPEEQAAFIEARTDPLGEARVTGDFPNYPSFLNGTLVTYESEQYYATVVAENPCFVATPLQFPLGVFAIALGIIGILTPPGYRKLVELEEQSR